jgi:hypothetical protein
MLAALYKLSVVNLKGYYNKHIHSSVQEYPLKIDGYYYSNKDKGLIIIVRMRNKRMIDKISLQEAALDKFLIEDLHPLDVCLIGILANDERNNDTIDQRMRDGKVVQIRHYHCYIKSKPLLTISETNFYDNGEESLKLKARYFSREITITASDLLRNEALMYALDPEHALRLGFGASESMRKQAMRM